MPQLSHDESESLLKQLESERGLFTKSDPVKMQSLVDQLVQGGVYPALTPVMQKHNYTHFTMMQSWGARWHEWTGKLNCPHCNADLRDKENGPPFKREIGIEDPAVYDGVCKYKCPDCKQTWDRFAFKL